MVELTEWRGYPVASTELADACEQARRLANGAGLGRVLTPASIAHGVNNTGEVERDCLKRVLNLFDKVDANDEALWIWVAGIERYNRNTNLRSKMVNKLRNKGHSDNPLGKREIIDLLDKAEKGLHQAHTALFKLSVWFMYVDQPGNQQYQEDFLNLLGDLQDRIFDLGFATPPKGYARGKGGDLLALPPRNWIA